MKNEKSAKNSKELKLKIGLWGYKKRKDLVYRDGWLLIYDDEIVIKGLIKKSASFDRSALCVEVRPDNFIYKVIIMSDNNSSYEILTGKKQFKKLMQCIG